MTEASLYERLGGVFAIAAVVDHFSDEIAISEVKLWKVLAKLRYLSTSNGKLNQQTKSASKRFTPKRKVRSPHPLPDCTLLANS